VIQNTDALPSVSHGEGRGCQRLSSNLLVNSSSKVSRKINVNVSSKIGENYVKSEKFKTDFSFFVNIISRFNDLNKTSRQILTFE
jgi:hypothetical protein